MTRRGVFLGDTMRKIFLALLLCVLPSVAEAQWCAARQDTLGTLISSNGQPGPMAVSAAGVLYTTVNAGDASIGKIEDAVHLSAGTGAFTLGVANQAATVLCGDGDYCPMATTQRGASFAVIDSGYQLSATTGLLKAEDIPSASSDALVSIGAVREDALTTSTSNTGDYSHLKTDGNGRLIVTAAPPGETWQGCGTSTATTADVAIKAAVASNRIYVTSITCKNTDATVAPNLDFKDGATIIAVGAIPADSAITVPNSFVMTFPTPLRGTVNTAFNFAANTASTSIICCANGYISVL